MFLPQGKAIGMTGGEVAEVKRDTREGGHLHRLPHSEKALSDPTLIQHLNRACVQPASTPTGALDLGAWSPLQHDCLHPGQCQFRCQHHPVPPPIHPSHSHWMERGRHGDSIGPLKLSGFKTPDCNGGSGVATRRRGDSYPDLKCSGTRRRPASHCCLELLGAPPAFAIFDVPALAASCED